MCRNVVWGPSSVFLVSCRWQGHLGSSWLALITMYLDDLHGAWCASSVCLSSYFLWFTSWMKTVVLVYGCGCRMVLRQMFSCHFLHIFTVSPHEHGVYVINRSRFYLTIISLCSFTNSSLFSGFIVVFHLINHSFN